MIITIDGPAGSGKSTVARLLAKRLNIAYLDTGAMYRCITLASLQSDMDMDNAESLNDLARQCKIRFAIDQGIQHVFLDDQDVTQAIRTQEVTAAAHKVAGAAPVRATLVEQQQAIGREYGSLVTEGRDQGTVVFPEAQFKFYLDASDTCRARRRWEQLGRPNGSAGLKNILSDQKTRDHRDRSRQVGPLKPAADARIIDTTHMNIDQVVDTLYAIIMESEK